MIYWNMSLGMYMINIHTVLYIAAVLVVGLGSVGGGF